MFRMLFSLNNDTLILFFEKNFFVREINMKKRLKPENTQKVPIVVLFANEAYYQVLSRLRYTTS